jgi:hypothetical protein
MNAKQPDRPAILLYERFIGYKNFALNAAKVVGASSKRTKDKLINSTVHLYWSKARYGGFFIHK